jgi:hypothetical protein
VNQAPRLETVVIEIVMKSIVRDMIQSDDREGVEATMNAGRRRDRSLTVVALDSN